MKNRLFQIFGLVILLLTMVLPSWLIENDRVLNVDEPRWIARGANFYYAVTHGEFEKTIFEYHPGVTNMWIVGTAMHIYFPEYRGLGQGYFDPLKMQFEEFMREHGREALDVVRVSRLIHAAILAFLIVVTFLLLCKLVDPNAAFLSSALVAVAPFYLGHSRLMNLEGMLSLFVLISFLGMQVYLNKERKLIYLLISAISFSLAQLTKSSSLVLLGLIGLMLFIELFKQAEKTFSKKVYGVIKTFIIWAGVAVLTYFILWPGMWVAPREMLSEVYGNAFSYALQGARLDVTEELGPENFELVSDESGIWHFVKNWAASSTPITWIGLFFAMFFLFIKNKEDVLNSKKSIWFYVAILGGLFILMFGLAQGRDSQHYILSSYVAFDVIAGIGWGSALLWAGSRWKWVASAYGSVAVMVGVILAQIGFGLPYAPYYFTYKNPLASEPATYAYGEGYSEAADYLAQKPNAKELRAYVYNGMGTFSYFFPGETLVFKRVYLLDESFEQIADEIRSSDYLVLYPIARKKQPETEKILGVLKDVTPEKTILINGLDYLYIYHVPDIPEAVYEDLTNQ